MSMSLRLAQTALASLFLMVGACSERPAGTANDIGPEIVAWAKLNTQAFSPTAIKLRDGTCLDGKRVPRPWAIATPDPVDPLNPALLIAADGDAVRISPYEVPGRKEDWYGRPQDGRVWVSVVGWSNPEKDYLESWLVGPPATVDASIRKTPTPAANGTPTLWTVKISSESYPYGYVDSRRLTQCRDYGPDIPLIWCEMVSQDEQYKFAVQLDASNLPRLPQVLNSISEAIEKARGPCELA
nr:hypothetical protein [Brevundimonas diminuta]